MLWEAQDLSVDSLALLHSEHPSLNECRERQAGFLSVWEARMAKGARLAH